MSVKTVVRVVLVWLCGPAHGSATVGRAHSGRGRIDQGALRAGCDNSPDSGHWVGEEVKGIEAGELGLLQGGIAIVVFST